jgi:hypothetical protein
LDRGSAHRSIGTERHGQGHGLNSGGEDDAGDADGACHSHAQHATTAISRSTSRAALAAAVAVLPSSAAGDEQSDVSEEGDHVAAAVAHVDHKLAARARQHNPQILLPLPQTRRQRLGKTDRALCLLWQRRQPHPRAPNLQSNDQHCHCHRPDSDGSQTR